MAVDSIRILHVDDDPGFADLTATFLERVDPRFEVFTTNRVSDAVEQLHEADIDCIISDYQMPETDGLDFLRTIRDDFPELPFILFTGQGSEEIASEAISAGIDEYIQKSTSREQYTVLANRVDNLVEKYRAQQELTVKDQAMDAAPIGILLTDPAREDNPIVYTNDGFQQLTGYTEEEILGRNCRFLQGEDTDREPIAEMREAIDAQRPVSVDVLNYRKDGTPFWNRVDIAPVYDRDGTLSRYVGFQRDVTKQKEARLELEEIINRISDAFFALDSDWRFTYLNDHAQILLNRDREDVIGEPVWEEFPAARNSIFDEKYHEAMATQEPVTFTGYYGPLDTEFEVRAYPSDTGLSVYFREATNDPSD